MFSVNLYRSFVQICKEGLDLNGHLIHDDQREYHESLRKNFSEMSERLGQIFGESVSVAIFTSLCVNYGHLCFCHSS